MPYSKNTFDELISSIENNTFHPNAIDLNLNGRGIDDKDAAQLCEALTKNPTVAGRITRLNLSFNRLSSFDIPATLVALKELYLGDNQLSNFNVPGTLVALEELNLNSNQLSSFNIPDTLVALQRLYLGDNQLSSFNIPDTLVALQELNLGSNQLSSFNIPDTLVALQRINLSGNQLSSFNIPATLVALKELNLGRNQLSSINVPDTLVALQELYLGGNQISSFNVPDTLVALQRLYLGVNQLSSFNIPDTLVALQWLYLNGNQLSSFNIPDTLVALKEFNLGRNQLSSINFPATLALTQINVSNNPLSPLARLILQGFGENFPRLRIVRDESPNGEEITHEMITVQRNAYFSPEKIISRALTPNHHLQTVKEVTTALLVSQFGLKTYDYSIAKHIAKFLIPKLDVQKAIAPYSLGTIFGWLPQALRPSKEIMDSITVREAEDINGAVAYEEKGKLLFRYIQIAEKSSRYKMLAALNQYIADENLNVREAPGFKQALVQIRENEEVTAELKRAAVLRLRGHCC